MRTKIKIVAAAAFSLMIAGCAKVETGTSLEIKFQLANYVSTKAVSYANGPFGVNAWYKGETAAENVDYFMNNQKVTGVDGSADVWNPTTTYYWPRSGYINFIAYSPFSESNAPTMTESEITYNNLVVSDVDIMYSDRSMYNTAETSANGVPILFHHALAKVKIKVQPIYDHVWDSTTGTYTYWEITIDSPITIPYIYSTGSLKLTLNEDGTSWSKPTNNIWDPTANATTTLSIPTPGDITDPDYVPTAISASSYVLPQLAAGRHFNFTCTIKTYRGTGATEEEAKANATLVLSESQIPISGTIPTNETNPDLNYWSMNTVTTYTIHMAASAEGKVKKPVYVADKDGDGKPDTNPDGTYQTTEDPKDAYKDKDGNPVQNDTPVYVADKDGDGKPDTNPDGTVKTTTDPDEALHTDPSNPNSDPVYVKDKDHDGQPEYDPATTTKPDDALRSDPSDPTSDPVYVKDKDHDGVPDRDKDGNIETTTNPDDALWSDPKDPTSDPVYVADKDHDGQPDPDHTSPQTTTNPDDALTTPEYDVENTNEPVVITFDPAVTDWEEIEVTAPNV